MVRCLTKSEWRDTINASSFHLKGDTVSVPRKIDNFFDMCFQHKPEQTIDVVDELKRLDNFSKDAVLGAISAKNLPAFCMNEARRIFDQANREGWSAGLIKKAMCDSFDPKESDYEADQIRSQYNWQ